MHSLDIDIPNYRISGLLTSGVCNTEKFCFNLAPRSDQFDKSPVQQTK